MNTLKIEGRHRKVYIIEQSGLRIQSFKNQKLPSESFIPFENMKRDRFLHKERPYLFLLIAGIFLLICGFTITSSTDDNPNYFIGVATLSFLCLLSITFYFIFQPRNYFVKTFTGNYIKFSVAKNEEQIDHFVRHLIQKRDEYLKAKYGTPNKHMSYDAQFSNFNIMHKEQIISTEELQAKIDTLNNMFKQSAPKTNFFGYSEN